MSDDASAVRGTIAKWLAASERGDAKAIEGLLAEDAVFLVAGQPPMIGRDAFLEAFRTMTKALKLKGEWQERDLIVDGSHAYYWGWLRVTLSPKPFGKKRSQAGYTLTVFRKEPDGQWILVRDANMLMPEADQPDS